MKIIFSLELLRDINYYFFMKRYKIRVKIAGGRIVDIEISAPDAHAALGMARSQYGQENVLGAPVEVR